MKDARDIEIEVGDTVVFSQFKGAKVKHGVVERLSAKRAIVCGTAKDPKNLLVVSLKRKERSEEPVDGGMDDYDPLAMAD